MKRTYTQHTGVTQEKVFSAGKIKSMENKRTQKVRKVARYMDTVFQVSYIN